MRYCYIIKRRRLQAGEPEGKELELFLIYSAAALELQKEKENRRLILQQSCKGGDRGLRKQKLQREAAQDEAISITYRRRKEIEEEWPTLFGRRPGSRTKIGNIRELLARYHKVLKAGLLKLLLIYN